MALTEISKVNSTDKGVTLAPDASGHVTLPPQVDASACQMVRDGQDLVLRTPDGQSFIIEGYFLAADAPVIVSAAGAVLSPQLVQSFLAPDGNTRLAANAQANDASPVGEVTETTGNATVKHADGTVEKITAGTQIYEGDIIETDAKGAVNIKFADDSTFAVSKNARLAVDDFSFNPADQSGSTGLSILRGVFMFTSGLVGRENPDAVKLNTPVGSIGIRGTIVGGEIDEGGQSQISVLEGAIVVRNGTGEQILSDQFATVQLTGYNAPISNLGTLDANTISNNYNAVRSVAPSLFTSIDDAGGDTGNQPQQQQAQPQQDGEARSEQQQQPQGEQPQGAAPQNGPEGANGQQPPAGQQPAVDTQGQPQQGQGPNGQGPNAGEPLIQGQNALPQGQQPPAPQGPPIGNTPIFQTLQTGSNIENTLGAPPQNPLQNPNPPIAPVNVAPPPPPPPPPPPQVTPPNNNLPPETPLDTRPPAPPVFILGGHVDEQSPIGTVVGTVAMSQSLPFPVTYSIVNNPGGVFAINPSTGVVTLAAVAGDSELGVLQHGLTVRVTRTETSQFAESALTVPVLPVNEAPIFPAGAPILVNEGDYVELTPAHIGASDPEGLTNLTYIVNGVTKGSILVDSGSGFVSAPSFTAAELANHKVKYVHGGDEPGGASVLLVVRDPANNTSTQRVFGITVSNVNDDPVNQVSTGGVMAENASKVVQTANLLWTDSDHNPASVVYTLSTSTHGKVQKNAVDLAVNDTFTQADINNGLIQFIQNGDENTSASFHYTVTDGVASSQNGTVTFAVTPVNDAPGSPINNAIAVNEGSHGLITSSQLHYSDPDNNTLQLQYTLTSAPTNGSVQKYDGSNWNTVTSFTQHDINDNKIRFLHNDTETTSAGFEFQLSDGAGSTQNGTYNVTVTPVNDAPASITFSTTSADMNEDNVSGVALGTFTITDSETVNGSSPYSFVIQKFNGSAWVADTRFEAFHNGTSWALKTKIGETFDHETEPTLTLRAQLTDGGNGAVTTTNTLTFTINDTNDPATDFILNKDDPYSVSYTAIIQGRSPGAFIALIEDNDLDTNPLFSLDASNYQVSVISGSGITTGDLEIVDITRDGKSETILRVKNGSSTSFSDAGNNISVQIRFDKNDDGFGANDVIHTYTLQGRNDTMLLESVNGKTGFRIANDSRFGSAAFGASLSAGDFNNDGRNDLAFGAPNASNSTSENSGGLYGFQADSGFITDANDGIVHLRTVTGIGGPPYTNSGDYDPASDSVTGVATELATAGSDNNALFASQLAALKRFNGSVGAELAVTNAKDGEVRVFNNGNPGTYLSIGNIAADFTNASDKTKAITIASIGDINGDGFTDLLIGTPYADTDGSDHGAAYVVFGANTFGSSLDITNLGANGFKLNTGNTINEKWGMSVTGLGDFNGDGYNDFAVSATGVDTDGPTGDTNHGTVTVYFGAPSANASYYNNPNNSVVIRGSIAGGTIGTRIADAGDFNGDGKDDLMILSPSENTNEGSIFVAYGKDTLGGTSPYIDVFDDSTSNGFKMTWGAGTDPNIRVGHTFGRAGDFNGDGYDDIFVDVYKNATVGEYEHSLIVVYGSATQGTAFNLEAAMTDASKGYKFMLGSEGSANLSATALGDLNGDGYEDLMIGVSGAENGAGEAYVVYGSNYNQAATSFSGTTTATANGQNFAGSTGDDLMHSGGNASLSFLGGDGHDMMAVSSSTGVRNFNGGNGYDTLRLDQASSTIDLRGISSNLESVEKLAFANIGGNNNLKLNIQDILTLASTAKDGRLIITDLGSSQDSNELQLFNNATQVTDLFAGLSADLKFTNDADSVGGQDFESGYYIYTHVDSGAQIAVDSRILNSGSLASG